MRAWVKKPWPSWGSSIETSLTGGGAHHDDPGVLPDHFAYEVVGDRSKLPLAPASFSTAPAWQASSMTTSLPLMPASLRLNRAPSSRGRVDAPPLDLGGKHVEDAVVVAMAVAREEDDPDVLGLHGVLEPPEPIEKSLLGGLAVDQTPDIGGDAGEGLGVLGPEDILKEFRVIGGILELERFLLVVGDADQEGVEPGRSALRCSS